MFDNLTGSYIIWLYETQFGTNKNQKKNTRYNTRIIIKISAKLKEHWQLRAHEVDFFA